VALSALAALAGPAALGQAAEEAAPAALKQPSPRPAAPNLNEALAKLADRIAQLGGLGRAYLVAAQPSPSLLEGYAARVLLTRLTYRGLAARQVAGIMPAPGAAMPERLPPCVPAEPDAPRTGLFVQVLCRDGEKNSLLACLYDVAARKKMDAVETAFDLPEDLAFLAGRAGKPMPAADRKWLELLLKMAPQQADDAGAFEAALAEAEADYFIETGLWAPAADRLLKGAEPGGARFVRAVFCLGLAGDAAGARARVQGALKEHPDSGALYALSSWLTLRDGKRDDALMLLEQARLCDMAHEGLYRYARGLIALEWKDEESAEKAFLRAAEAMPRELFVQWELARFYWRRAELDKAVAQYRRVVALKDCPPEAWSDLGVALDAADKSDEAIDALQRAFELDPRNPAVSRHLAALLKRAGRYEKALEVLRRASEADPCNPALLAAYGDCAAQMWRLQTAEGAFRKAAEIDGPFPYATVRLAEILAFQYRYAEAQRLLEGLLKERADYTPALIALGRILGRLGRTDQALKALAEAARSTEHAADAQLAMAEVYLKASQAEQAVRSAQIAAGLRADAQSYATLSDAFLAAGELAKAETTAASAMQRDAASEDAHLAAARCLTARGERDRALAETQKALAINPYSVRALRLSGTLYDAMGQPQKCAEAWRAALKLNPWQAELECELAELLRRKLGDLDGALEHYRKCIQLENLRSRGAAAGTAPGADGRPEPVEAR